MTFKISEFPGLDENRVTLFQGAGIENSDDLMRLWADKANRGSLVSKTGLTMEQFTKVAAMARLARVNNVGMKYVEVLLAAGIDGPKRLFEFTPGALVKHLQEVVAEKKLTYPVPTLVELGAWFVDVKPVVVAA